MKKILLPALLAGFIGAQAQWVNVPGDAVEISCASATDVVINKPDVFQGQNINICYKRDFSTNTWTQMTGANKFHLFDIAKDGAFWCLSSDTNSNNSNMVRFDSIPAKAFKYSAVNLVLSNNISVKDSIFAIGCTGTDSNNIWVINNYKAATKTFTFTQLPGSENFSAKKVVVGDDGSIFALSTISVNGNNVFKYIKGVWTPIATFEADDIAVGDMNKVLTVSGGGIYYSLATFVSSGWVGPYFIPQGSVSKVAVAGDGTIYITTTASTGNIYTNNWRSLVTGRCNGTTLPASPNNTTASSALSVCVGSSTVLEINGGASDGYWFLETDTTNLFFGARFTTPAITKNTTFYAQALLGVCASERVAFKVIVKDSVKPTVSQSANVLSTQTYSSYQWLLNGVDIPNAQSQTYATTQSGNYSVRVADASGCVGTSAVVNITGVGIDERKEIMNLALYPNPTSSNVTVTANENISKITITDMLGKVVFEQQEVGKTVTISTVNFSKGFYLVRVESNGATATKKLIKE